MSTNQFPGLVTPLLPPSTLGTLQRTAVNCSLIPPSFASLTHKMSLSQPPSFGATPLITKPSDLFHKPKPKSASEPANAFHACCFDHESPFVRADSLSCNDSNTAEAVLPPGCVAPPATVISPSFAVDVILPRLAAADHLLTRPPPHPPPVFTESYPANRVIDDLLSVIAHFCANRVSRARHASDIIAAYRGLLRATKCGDAALGPPPSSTKQRILGFLHLTDLHYLFADALFESYAELDSETGFGQEHEPLCGRDDARVAEAEEHLLTALQYHNGAAALVDSVSGGAGGRQRRKSDPLDSSPPPPEALAGLGHWDGPAVAPVRTRPVSSHRSSVTGWGDAGGIIAAAVRSADSLDALCGVSWLRPTNAVPTSLILTKHALVVAARGKRSQAVDVLERVAEMDPCKPEFELRPPQVTSSHRSSVENAKLGLLHYYNQRHDQRKADYYRDLVVSWRMRNIAAVRSISIAG
jgi:hypothetical protein